jgi:hypothetical protein
MHRCQMKLQFLQHPAGDGWWEDFIDCRWHVDAQVIEDDATPLGLGNLNSYPLSHPLGKCLPGLQRGHR